MSLYGKRYNSFQPIIWFWRIGELDSKALSKTQSAVLVAIVVLAGLAGVVAYVILGGQDLTTETIKIGIFADLDMPSGKFAWQGAILAAEQLNAEGGILGRQIEVVGEDNDQASAMDIVTYTSALTRLITYHNVDFLFGGGINVCEAIAEHKKIFFAGSGIDDIEQRVLEDYERYKYLFAVTWNITSGLQGATDSLKTLSENTNFTKVAYLAEDSEWTEVTMSALDDMLPALYGYEIVYKGRYPPGTVDFTSYFVLAEAADAEILIPFCGGLEGNALIKEWHDRGSPMVIYSGVLGAAGLPESWEITEGKCETISVSQIPIAAEYPFTSKTLPFREAYIERWDQTPGFNSALAYDVLRFILPDAIRRAGTIEYEAVIEALEQTNIETSQARTFAFSSSHGIMMGENPNDPDAEYMIMMVFQWQNGKMVPVHPQKIMEEAGATYIFPDWPGPWD